MSAAPKVNPEEVEAVINRHPGVHASLVKARKNPITGALVAADVVLNEGREPTRAALKDEIVAACAQPSCAAQGAGARSLRARRSR